MKKYTLKADNKLVLYLFAFFIMKIAGSIFSLLTNQMVFERSGRVIDTTIIMILLNIYMLALILIVLKDCVTFVALKSMHMSFGLLKFNSVNYKDIKSVKFENDIIIHYYKKTKKIKVFNLDENKEKYLDILNTISEKSNLNFSPERALASLESHSNKRYNVGNNPLRLNGWIFVIFLTLILYVIGTVLQVSSNTLLLLLNRPAPNLAGFIISIAQSVFAIVIIIFMAKRQKRSVLLLKIYCVVSFASGIVSAILQKQASIETMDVLFWVNTTLSALTLILITLALFRYFDMSQRVKKTFIYDKFQTVTCADRAVDPPFKIFSKESPSLFVFFSVILLPALIIIALVGFVIFAVFAALL